jgi:hypothetical protein
MILSKAKYVSDKEVYGAVIAFWDGQIKGTKHMIDTANKMGLETHIIKYNN